MAGTLIFQVAMVDFQNMILPPYFKLFLCEKDKENLRPAVSVETIMRHKKKLA